MRSLKRVRTATAIHKVCISIKWNGVYGRMNMVLKGVTKSMLFELRLAIGTLWQGVCNRATSQ